jgi:glucosamine--fructose-6-phosphate aminotransferase (isomerizing)
MCGIFGYTGPDEAAPLLLAGLERLAYRGYDSAGIALRSPAGALTVRKAAGRIGNLAALVEREPAAGTSGVGHTRWATHGAPSDANAHPHTDAAGRVVAVHNGIVENHTELRERLVDAGYAFSSATDTEVIPNLIAWHLDRGASFPEAVRRMALELRGAHAIVCMHADTPGTLVALRIGHAGGALVGHAPGASLVASDLTALTPFTHTVTFLEPGQMAVVTPGGCTVSTLEGEPVAAAPRTVEAGEQAAAKGGYKHFMLKEIFEQPESATSALRGRLAFDPPGVSLGELPFGPEVLRAVDRAVLLGMGTSLNAAMLGARYIEALARIPAVAENAAEFRYRDPVVGSATLVVAVTQSGETADTLEALALARRAGARTIAITNTANSQATHMAEGTLLMHAGQEVGVASSKTFITSAETMLLLAGAIGSARGTLDAGGTAELVETAARLPALIGDALALNADAYPRLVARFARARRFLFLGRGLLEPIAREGALKLKEISYVHAEGMAAAEMKHGPIALVDAETPTVAFALRDGLHAKMLANLAEVHARGGPVLVIATEGDAEAAAAADEVLWVPPCPPLLAPLAAVVPAQLLSYHLADALGNDVDQPRNLAKSVTVE